MNPVPEHLLADPPSNFTLSPYPGPPKPALPHSVQLLVSHPIRQANAWPIVNARSTTLSQVHRVPRLCPTVAFAFSNNVWSSDLFCTSKISILQLDKGQPVNTS